MDIPLTMMIGGFIMRNVMQKYLYFYTVPFFFYHSTIFVNEKKRKNIKIMKFLTLRNSVKYILKLKLSSAQ